MTDTAIRDANLASEHLKNALYLASDDTVKINYAYNGGGYESYIYFVTADSGVLAIDTVIAEIDSVDFTDMYDPQWFIVGAEINYEDEHMYDDHTNKLIPSAYGED